MKTTDGMDRRIAQLQAHCVAEKETGIVRIYPVSQRKMAAALVRGGACRRMTRAEVMETFGETLEDNGRTHREGRRAHVRPAGDSSGRRIANRSTGRQIYNLKLAAFEADDMLATARILYRSFGGIQSAAPDAQGKKLAAKAEAAIGVLIDDLTEVSGHFCHMIGGAQ